MGRRDRALGYLDGHTPAIFLVSGCTNIDEDGDAGVNDKMAPPTVACTVPNRNEITLTDFDVETDTIVADLAEVFAESDLGTASLCHSGVDMCSSMFHAAGLVYPGPGKLQTQTFFRTK